MEIGNNNNSMMNRPAFGMAFIKPNSSSVQRFNKYVNKGRNAALVKRGLAQIEKNQAANKHFDIGYDASNNSIHIIPKTDNAREIYGLSKIDENRVYPTELQRVISKIDKGTESGRNGLSKGLNSLKNAFKCLAARIRTYTTNPKDNLPANLRMADDFATGMEKSVDEKIARDKILREGVLP